MRKIPNIKLSEVRDLVAQNKALSVNTEWMAMLENFPSWFVLDDVIRALPPAIALTVFQELFGEYKFNTKAFELYSLMVKNINDMKEKYTADADEKIHNLYHSGGTSRQHSSAVTYRSSVRYITRRAQEDIVDATFRFESEFANELCKFIKQGKVY